MSDAETWDREEGVTCVVCPECAFTFDAIHTDADGGYSCPECENTRLRAALTEIRADCLWHHAEYGDHPHVCLTIAGRALGVSGE